MSKLTSTCPEDQFAAWIFFLNYESFWIFCRNFWHGSQKSIYVSRVKIAEELALSSFQNFFRILSEKISVFWQKNFQKLSKLPCACADEQFLAWKFFQKFWTVLDFLHKSLAWFSNFYLRVQSKNSGRNIFLNLLFRVFFRILREAFFRLLAKKLLEVFKTTFYVSRGTVYGLKYF